MKHLYLIVLMIISANVLAQTPEAFSYQAVVRNSSGEILAGREVSFRISILEGSETGPSVYRETHFTSSNKFGLVNLKIGKGNPESGDFSPAGWGNAPHYIKVEFDPEGGEDYLTMGINQLLAVPYAFHAQTVEDDKTEDADADPANELQVLSLSGSELSLSEGGGTVTLPSGTTDIWSAENGNIFYNTGKVGIGTNPGADLRQFQVVAGNVQAIAAENNSNYPALFVQNKGSGNAAEFRNRIKIMDGTEGPGKVLTSDANGNTHWSTAPIANLWGENDSEIYAYSYVGLGTTNPDHNLDIVNSTSSLRIRSTTAGAFEGDASLIIDKAGTGNYANINFRSAGSSEFFTGLLGNNNYRISADFSSLSGLEIQSDGNINISNELQTSETGSANMIPIAYGTVTGGVLRSGSGNVSVNKTGTGEYSISINGESYFYSSYTVSLTLLAKVGFIEGGSVSGNLLVFTYDKSGASSDANFTFVVYKP